MIYFTAHTFNCVCHCIRVMFRVLGIYNFGVLVSCDHFHPYICYLYVSIYDRKVTYRFFTDENTNDESIDTKAQNKVNTEPNNSKNVKGV